MVGFLLVIETHGVVFESMGSRTCVCHTESSLLGDGPMPASAFSLGDSVTWNSDLSRTL